MSYMYRAIGSTAAVGTPSSLCSVSLPHDQNQILRVFIGGGPVIPLLLPARVVCQLVGCWPALGSHLAGVSSIPSFLPSFLPYERRRALVLFARLVAPSFLVRPSVRPRVSPSPLGKWVSSTRRYLGLLCDGGGAVVIQEAALIYFKEPR